MGGAIVADLDLEANGVAFVWRRITTGKRFDSHQISIVIDGNRFSQVIANGVRIRLITRSRGRNVSDRVAAFAYINGSCER